MSIYKQQQQLPEDKAFPCSDSEWHSWAVLSHSPGWSLQLCPSRIAASQSPFFLCRAEPWPVAVPGAAAAGSCPCSHTASPEPGPASAGLSPSSSVALPGLAGPSESPGSRADVLVEALAAARVHRQAGLLPKAHQEPVYLLPEVPAVRGQTAPLPCSLGG